MRGDFTDYVIMTDEYRKYNVSIFVEIILFLH